MSPRCFLVLVLAASIAMVPKLSFGSHANEKPIVFETMDGQTTDAFKGYIKVPEYRSNPESRMIEVHYVRFPGTNSAKKGNPIVYLAGGPGGSGIQTARYPGFRYPLFMALRQHGDVIALDQRGTGASKTIEKCRSGQRLPMTEAASDDDIAATYRAALDACLVQWKAEGAEVKGYTTRESASDLEDLRKHLKAKKLILWGISYGSHLALASIKQYPKSFEKVVIASAEGLNQTVKLPARTDGYFEKLQSAVNTQPAAAKAYPDIAALMKRVHKRLEANPMQVSIPVKGGEPIPFLFQRFHMQILASSMISDPHRGVSTLLALYKEIDNDSQNLLTGVLSRGFFSDPEVSLDLMSSGMDIASGITDARLDLVNQQARSSLLGLALNFPMPQLNRSVPGLDLGDEFRKEALSDVPTLLLTGTLDGRTYYDAQLEATAGLSNRIHVVVENAGHNLFMSSPLVTEAIHQFLNGEEVLHRNITIPLPQLLPNAS